MRELRLCRVYGISHSHFLGGPPRWTELDQDKAMALEEIIATTCGNCGTRAEEWEDDPHAYLGHHWRCPGCEVIEQERDNVPEDAKGVHVGVLPKDVALRAAAAEAAAKE